MLALKSYEQSNGFSVMDADELFFINGGSSEDVKPFVETTNDGKINVGISVSLKN